MRVLLVDSLSTLTQYHPLLWWLLETGPSHVSQTPSEVPRDTESETPRVKSVGTSRSQDESFLPCGVCHTGCFSIKFSH